jgi:hypothetical protein
VPLAIVDRLIAVLSVLPTHNNWPLCYCQWHRGGCY